MPFVAQMPTPLDAAIALLFGAVKDKDGNDQPLPTVQTDDNWLTYFLNKDRLVAQTVRSLVPVSLKNQQAAIGTSPIALGSLPSGLYVIGYYLRVTQPASTSSAVQVTIGWTDGGAGCARSGPSVTGNLTSTTDAGLFLLQSDAPGTLTYSTTYASVGAVSMQHSLSIAALMVPNNI